MNFERQISPNIIQLSPQGTSFTVEECNVATYLNTNRVISSAGQFFWCQAADQTKAPAHAQQSNSIINIRSNTLCTMHVTVVATLTY